MAGTAARSSSASRTGRNGAVAKPERWRKVFSAIRSCAIATASTGGRTRLPRANRSSAAAGTFSNSVVMAAHDTASSSSARSSV